jgi:hypothetical protein
MNTSNRVQTDIKKLKQKYNVQLSSLKELFSEWTEEDLLFTLQDTDGDLDLAIDRISEGHANQWDEVKTKKSKKEAAAANKPTTPEAVLTIPATTAPATTSTTTSTTTTTPSHTAHSKYNNNRTKRPISTSHRPVNYQQKPQTTSWQSNNWSNNDSHSWNSNGWNDSTPKKPSSTPSSSTKSSKTWASLLQSKEKPETVPIVEKDLPPLKKVDDSWLTPSKEWNNVNIDSDVPIDLSSLSLKENEKKNAPEDKSSHISVADLLNSVKQPSLVTKDLQQPEIPTTNTNSIQPSFQNFAGLQQDYQTPFNPIAHDYGMYGGSDQFFHLQQQQQQQQQQQRPNYYDQKFASPKQSNNETLFYQQPSQQHLYNNFYPYYQQQFNTYSPYNNNNNRSLYPQQTTTLPTTTTTSSSNTATTGVQSPYSYNSQNLYGFNDFGFSGQYREEESKKSSSPQQYPSIFSYGRNNNLQQPYWNQ